MRQAIISVALPIADSMMPILPARIEVARLAAGGAGGSFTPLDAIPGLHFFSIMTFGSDAGVPQGHAPVTPLLVLEANVDGEPGPFWAGLEAVMGEALRDLLRCCLCPLSGASVLFASVTKPFSRAPVAPLLQRCQRRPAASHRGHRGLSRKRILRHDWLFKAIQARLPSASSPACTHPEELHATLRADLLSAHPWLDEDWQAPISSLERAADILFLCGVGGSLLAAAAVPWLIAGEHLPIYVCLALALLAAAACFLSMPDFGDLLTLFGYRASKNLPWVIAILLVGLATVVAMHPAWDTPRWMLAPAGILASLALLVAGLRARERSDPIPSPANPDPARVRALAAWEGRRPPGADHMGSVVLVKSGLFRAFLVRLGLLIVDRFVQITAVRGYLGSMASNRSMRSIHFAHWVLLDGGRRQMFLSNFDGSWESYLDDFIIKEGDGLTIVWGNGLGFPSTRYLVLDGARQGRQFKDWARLSMAPTQLHFAAYPHLTVNQIFRQAEVARGLSAPKLDPKAAALWAQSL